MENINNKNAEGVVTVNLADEKSFLAIREELVDVKIADGTPEIGHLAFKECKRLKSVIAPKSVKSVGGAAFAFCGSLESAELPDGVVSLGNGAFSGCASLKSVKIPAGVKLLAEEVFGGCSALESVLLPEGLTEIKPKAFVGCRSLKHIDIPAGVRFIDSLAFWTCGLESVTVPDEAIVSKAAFAECPDLKSITWRGKVYEDVEAFNQAADDYLMKSDFIAADADKDDVYAHSGLRRAVVPGSVYEIGCLAFAYSSALRSAVIEEGLRSIGFAAFNSCHKLKDVTLPDSLEEIGDSAFCCCAIESIDLPCSLKQIGSEAFYGCDHLKRLDIPDSVEKMAADALECCDNLLSITFRGRRYDESEKEAFNKAVKDSGVSDGEVWS